MSTDALPQDLHAYGWDAEWAAALAQHAPEGTVPARVARVDRGACTAIGAARAYRVQLLPKTAWPVTGDWIAVDPTTSDNQLDQLAALLPRRKAMHRMDADERRAQLVAANVDVFLAVIPLDRPFKPGLRDRLLVLAGQGQADPVLVLTKADVADPAQLALAEADTPEGFTQILTGAKRGQGVEEVRAAIGPGRTGVLLGPSGAGKSTLANALVGEDVQRTGEVRDGDHKGRHTTTARELLLLPTGGVLIDTPGVRAVGLWDAEESIDEVFGDIAELVQLCHFSDCGHGTEPGCAAREAIADGELDAARFRRWQELTAEAEAQQRRRIESGRRGGRR